MPGRRNPRREFLEGSARGLLSAAIAPLLASCVASSPRARPGRVDLGYGPLGRIADQNGEAILALPEGFRYVTFGRSGQPMLDGSGRVPRNPDGMGCFAAPGGLIRLIRNHELRNDARNMAFGVPHALTPYDRRAMGGTLTIDFDPAGMRPVREFVSLCGTYANCGGGHAYRGAGWLTCEETTADWPQGFARPHGYAYWVPAHGARPGAPPAPLKAMGRFIREAVVADRSGVVYQTEDSGDTSGFYRFLPTDAADLARGGRLQMLRVANDAGSLAYGRHEIGKPIACDWVDIADPDPNLALGAASCFAQGAVQGGAAFNRLEGIQRGEGDEIYFVSTHGGAAQRGQLWCYRPVAERTGTLALACEAAAGGVLDCPDSLCLTPRGGMLFCEDHASGNRLVGLSRDGLPFELAANIHDGSELTGACFSPDGRILFVNVYGRAATSGRTCAIIGPWEAGPL